MPVTQATLLATPNTTINIRTVSPGQYFHYGIEKHFLNRAYPTITEDDVKIKQMFQNNTLANSRSSCLSDKKILTFSHWLLLRNCSARLF